MRFTVEIVFNRFIQLILAALLLIEVFFLYHGLSYKDPLLTELSVLLILVSVLGFLVIERFVREEYKLLREKRDINGYGKPKE